MTQSNVRQIEQRRPVRNARIHDLKHGLQVAIQINNRIRAALEGQWLIALIPPAMWHLAREPHRFAGPNVNALPADFCRQGAGCNQPFFILEVMNVQGRAFSMRGQRASELEKDFSILIPSPQFENLAGVFVL